MSSSLGLGADKEHRFITEDMFNKILALKQKAVEDTYFFTEWEHDLIEDRYQSLQKFCERTVLTFHQQHHLEKLYVKLAWRKRLEDFAEKIKEFEKEVKQITDLMEVNDVR